MSPIALCHVSPTANRSSISTRGLLPRKPTEDGNYVHKELGLSRQPRGVYAMPVGEDALRWRDTLLGDEPDQWIMSYVGRLDWDRIVTGALIALDPAPPESLTLETSHENEEET